MEMAVRHREHPFGLPRAVETHPEDRHRRAEIDTRSCYEYTDGIPGMMQLR